MLPRLRRYQLSAIVSLRPPRLSLGIAAGDVLRILAVRLNLDNSFSTADVSFPLLRRCECRCATSARKFIAAAIFTPLTVRLALEPLYAVDHSGFFFDPDFACPSIDIMADLSQQYSEQPNDRSCYVGNLAWSVRTEQLLAHFVMPPHAAALCCAPPRSLPAQRLILTFRPPRHR